MATPSATNPTDTDRPVPPIRPVRAAIAFWLTGLIGSIGFFSTLEDVKDGDSTRFDRLLLERAHLLSQSSDGEWMTPLAKILSLFGNWQVLIPVGVVLLIAAWQKKASWRVPLFYTIACAGSGSLILLTKYLVNRPRPQLFPPLEKAPFASFPSGHALYALVAYGFLTFLFVRSTRFPIWSKVVFAALALTLTLLAGASRVYLGTHYPTDVMAGYLLGLPWLSALLAGECHYRNRDLCR